MDDELTNFQPNRSTEIAMTPDVDELHMAAYQNYTSALMFKVLSATFNTVIMVH